MKRGLATASAIVVLGAAGCSSDDNPLAPAEVGASPTASATSDGWRTESFGDAEISVPSDWGYQTGDVAAALWCISDAAVSAPVVVRPGLPVEPTCPGPAREGDPDPSTLVEKAGTFVSMLFVSNDPHAAEGTAGDRETVKTGSVLVRVQAPPEQRQQILATLHRISTDANGCPVTDPISADPARRPGGTLPVAELTGIKSVAACRYAIPGGRLAAPPDDTEALDSTTDPLMDPSIQPDANLRPTVAPLLPSGAPTSTPTLLSSVLVSADAARDAVRGIAEAKPGAGPDSAGGCDGNDAKTVRGTEEIVLRVTTATG
ncbi:MAG TPA: hypothetical protein VMZ00_07165, partial [Sporichthya sp.]|nr:hypothetical protein [Sporichthya sp.]